MKQIEKELMELLKAYGGDRKQALKEHPGLEYLYALSDQRENLMEWYPFRVEGHNQYPILCRDDYGLYGFCRDGGRGLPSEKV